MAEEDIDWTIDWARYVSPATILHRGGTDAPPTEPAPEATQVSGDLTDVVEALDRLDRSVSRLALRLKRLEETLATSDGDREPAVVTLVDAHRQPSESRYRQA